MGLYNSNHEASSKKLLTTFYDGFLNTAFAHQNDVFIFLPPLKVLTNCTVRYSKFPGGGGLSSTIYDYAIFLQMLLNGGVYNGNRILSRNTVRMMTTNQIGDVNFGNNKFGLGFALVTEKSAGAFPSNPGTFSWGGAFSTSYWADPKEKMIILFYRQILDRTHGDLSDKFRVLAYSALTD